MLHTVTRSRSLWLMLGSVVAFAIMGALVKDLRERGFGTLELMVWRTLPGLPAVWLDLRRRGVPLRPRRPAMVALRTVAGTIAMVTNFWAVGLLALVQHTVVHLLQPIFVALASPWLLRERQTLATIAALALALLGAWIVLLPPEGSWSVLAFSVAMPLLPGLAALVSAVASALAHITLRLATGSEHGGRFDHGAPPDDPATVVFHFTAFVSLGGFVGALLLGEFRSLWDTDDAGAAMLRIIAMASTGLIGQLLMSNAYARQEASAVAIVAYAAIPISAVIDTMVWGASIHVTTAIGAIVMVLAGALLVPKRPRAAETSVDANTLR